MKLIKAEIIRRIEVVRRAKDAARREGRHAPTPSELTAALGDEHGVSWSTRRVIQRQRQRQRRRAKDGGP